MTDLVEKRIAICQQCQLYKDTVFGAVCNPKKYINKEGIVSYLPKDGFKKGCNCILRKKAASPSNHCIVGKW